MRLFRIGKYLALRLADIDHKLRIGIRTEQHFHIIGAAGAAVRMRELFQCGCARGIVFGGVNCQVEMPDELRQDDQREESGEPENRTQRRSGTRHHQSENRANKSAAAEQRDADQESGVGANELQHGGCGGR